MGTVANAMPCKEEEEDTNRQAIDCIYALSKKELSKVDRELDWVVGDLLRQWVEMRR